MLIRSITAISISLTFGCVAFAQTAYVPFTPTERLHWLVNQNLAPTALLEDVATAAASTMTNSPREYGSHWEGFGKRVGMVTANYGVSTVMEAGLGSIWGEDPRYTRTQGESFQNRLGHVVKMTFFARNHTGNTVPAYARLVAIPGSSFLANTWTPDSQATIGNAVFSTGLGFLGRMGANAFQEFRPRH